MTRASDILRELEAEDLAAIRAERDQALADLRATERECEILRGGTKVGVGASIATRPARSREKAPPCDASATERRMSMLENAVRTLDATLYDIAHRHGDCCEYDSGRRDGEKCDCPVCMARSALKAVEDWRYGGFKERPANRYLGAMAERLTNWYYPREVKIHAAWSKWSDDFKLASILRDRCPAPSARDWYVATSVVQWLATNVGMGILEAAGFKYQHFSEDYAAYQRKLEAQREAATNSQDRPKSSEYSGRG